MRNADNTLRIEAIKLASKALDVLTKAVDILVVDDDTTLGENDQAVEPVLAVLATAPKEDEPSAKEDETR